MNVYFANERLERMLTAPREATKRYGPQNARAIALRLDNLMVAESLEEMKNMPGGIHELKGDRKGSFAIRLSGGWRMVIEPTYDPIRTMPGGGIDWAEVRSVTVVEVVDYHG